MNLIINPGTGNVFGAELDHALANMKVWMAEIPNTKTASHTYNESRTKEEWDKYPNMARGRFLFDVEVELHDGKKFSLEVEMPGLPLDKVRFIGAPEQNIWDFPRLYVDGSSWVWKYSFVDFEQDDA